MVRTIDEIKAQMTQNFVNNTTIQGLYNLDNSKTFEEQFSKVSLESIFFFIVASAVWVLEKLFDTHKAEVQEIITLQKPHTLRWYATKAKEFLQGYDLPDNSDAYDTSQLTDEQITQARIITHAAVVEIDSEVRIKVATTEANKLAPVTNLSAFENYMSRIKDAGVKLRITSSTADKLYLELEVYVNPLVFSADGKINNNTEPVREAVYNYLKKLPFNGMLVLAYLIDELQKINGVVVPHVISANAKYGEIETHFEVMYQPDAGYLEFNEETDLEITYIPQSTIL